MNRLGGSSTCQIVDCTHAEQQACALVECIANLGPPTAAYVQRIGETALGQDADEGGGHVFCGRVSAIVFSNARGQFGVGRRENTTNHRHQLGCEKHTHRLTSGNRELLFDLGSVPVVSGDLVRADPFSAFGKMGGEAGLASSATGARLAINDQRTIEL